MDIRNVRRTGLVAVCLLLAATTALPQDDVDMEYADTVIWIGDDGSVQQSDSVRVDSATWREVKFTLKGGRTKLRKEGNRVLGISYGDSPRIFAEAMQALSRGQYERAASDFDGAKNAFEAGRCRKWVLEHASVKKGAALAAIGARNADRLSDAIAEFQAALDANPESLLLPEITDGVVRSHVLKRNWSEATAAADKLMETGKEISHPVWKARAQKLLAEILLAQQEFDRARAAYQELARLAKIEVEAKSWEIGKKYENDLRQLRMLGAVEQGWVLVAWAESGSAAIWDQARSYFETLGREPDFAGNALVSAAVLNGIGRCLLDSAPREALKKFIEAEVGYFTARREVARALYLKAQALDKIGGARNEAMAKRARQDLRDYHPGSEWANK